MTAARNSSVLEGVFSDEYGDYPTGSYVRNPPTSHHTPGSAPGCTLFVKLCQFDPADRLRVCLDTGNLPFLVTPDRPGIELIQLFRNDSEDVRLERWPPGAEVTLSVRGGIEILVLDGGFKEGGEQFEAQSWLRLPEAATLCAKAGTRGTTLWAKSGHLGKWLAAPT